MVTQSTSETRLIAMLIDGDNAQASLLEHILAETTKYGVVTTRRIYGDWTQTQMGGWKDSLHIHAIQPVQQFRYTVGKNSTDSALIIDAMDLLHSGRVNGFCIVSSDSDYTRIATRIREQGLFVMGIGRKITPKSFVNACEVFVYTENLIPEVTSKPTPKKMPSKSADWTQTVGQAIELGAQEDGWVFLGVVGTYVRQLDPAFDPRSFGFNQLSALVKSRSDIFETRETKSKSGPSVIYVRAVISS